MPSREGDISLPPLRDVIARHDLRANKRLGQNFLLDLNITHKIAAAIPDIDNHHVIEIGPGPGGLTRGLLSCGARKVTVIELDRRAIPALKDIQSAYGDDRLQIIEGDALALDIKDIKGRKPVWIAGNLPYNIATPLLFGWLKAIYDAPDQIAGMVLMFQKEVGDRIIAAPGSKSYGRLSVMSQYLCETVRVFDLPPSVFVPPPKIYSSVLRFIPLKLDQNNKPPFQTLEAVTAAAFGQRRKMLRRSLGNYTEALTESGIDATRRAETLSVEEFVTLAKAARV